LIVGKKKNNKITVRCSIAANKKKIQGTVLTGNAQNKLKLKMKFPRAADDTCTSSVRPQNKRYRIKTQLLSYRRRIYK
jgi:hypothetical protein